MRIWYHKHGAVLVLPRRIFKMLLYVINLRQIKRTRLLDDHRKLVLNAWRFKDRRGLIIFEALPGELKTRR